MANRFEWQTEDDFDWDKLPREPEERPSRPGRRWPLFLTVLVLLLGAGGVIFRQVQQRAAANTEAMRADILSSHNLYYLAGAEQDEELLLALLSGRESDWVAAQQVLLKNDLLGNRRPFGLLAQPKSPPATDADTDIILSPDLLTAELARSVPYQIAVGNGVTETVTLQETAVYRLGRERWLRSPPDEEYWGLRSSQSDSRLTLTYPQRDTAVADQLAPDLARKLEELCRTFEDLACDPEMQLEVLLSTDLGALAATAQPLVAASPAPARLSVVLPTPTLVGLPQDDAAYQALFRGYASQMVTAFVAHQVGYKCCDRAPMFQALVDYQLSRIGLRPWPVTEADYARVVAEQVRLSDLAEVWASSDSTELAGPDGWRVYTAVDYFLTENPQSTAVDLQRQLVEQDTFYSWLSNALAGQQDTGTPSFYSRVMRDWWLRGYAAAGDVAETAGQPLPAQDLYVTCVAQSELVEDIQVATLFHYDAQNDTWQNVYETSSFFLVSPLPGDDALLQQEFRFDDQRWTTSVSRDGQILPLIDNPEDYTVSFGQTDPSGNEVVAFTFPGGGTEAAIVSFDIANCTTDSCAGRTLPGVPIWSPNGERALFLIDPDAQLALLQTELRTVLFDERALTPLLEFYVGSRDELMSGEEVTRIRDLQPVAAGQAPFWLDNQTIGYLTGGENRLGRTSNLVVQPLDGGSEPQTLLTLDDLLAALDEETGSTRMWWIHYAMVHPQNPEILYVVAMNADKRDAHVFEYIRADGAITPILEARYIANHSLGLSPDGRYVVLTGMESGDIDQGEENALIQVYDALSQKQFTFLSLAADFPPFSTYDWATGGDWMALMLEENLIGLFAPATNELRLLETPPGVCAAPAWINR